jgi:hypothetical protein
VALSGYLEVKFTKTGGKKRFWLLERLWQFVVPENVYRSAA